MAADPPNDRRIAAKVGGGDRGGLGELYDAHGPSLYDYCHSLLGDPATAADAAADCVQDVFVIASGHLGRLRDPRRLRAWLYALARSRCRRQPTASGLDLAPAVVSGLGDPSAMPPGPDRTGIRAVTRRALDDLGADDREVLDLALRHGIGRTDLAAVLGVSDENAHGRVSSARARFEGAVAALMAPNGLEGQLSAAALLQDLPRVAPPPRLRDRVLHAAFDPQMSDARPPSAGPASGRRSEHDDAVAGQRAHVGAPPFDKHGFPVQPDAQPRVGRRWALAVAGVAVLVVVAAGIGGAVALLDRGGDAKEPADVPVLAAPSRLPALPSGIGVHGPIPAQTSPVATPSPTGTSTEPRPQSRPQSPPKPQPGISSSGDRRGAGDPSSEEDQPTRLAVSPNRVDLGTGRRASVVLRATGGALMWGSSPSSELLSVSPDSGAIPRGGRMRVTVTLDRSRASGPGRAYVHFGTIRGQVETVLVVWS